MKKLSIGMVAVALVVSGCGDGGGKAAGGGASTAAEGGISTGVSECENYLRKVRACIGSKVPQAQRALIGSSVDATEKSWGAITDRSALAQACKMASEQAKAAYAAYGCTM